MTIYSTTLHYYLDFTPPSLHSPDFISSRSDAALPDSPKTNLAIYVVSKGGQPWGAITVDFLARTAKYRRGATLATAAFPNRNPSSRGVDHHHAMLQAVQDAEGADSQLVINGDEFLRQV